MIINCFGFIEVDKERGVTKTDKNITTTDMKLCSTSSSKTYMDYRAITDKTSKQYKYIDKNMYIDDTKGLLLDEDGFIGVALGSYFGEIGSRYLFTLNDEKIIPVVKVEEKANIHVRNGCEHLEDNSVIEFVIDKDVATNHYGVAKNGYIVSGNFNNIEEFNGSIKSVALVTDVSEKEETPKGRSALNIATNIDKGID